MVLSSETISQACIWREHLVTSRAWQNCDENVVSKTDENFDDSVNDTQVKIFVGGEIDLL